MIRLSGKMTVKIINGRNGAFRVGVLRTEVGEFAVKDQLLDQYEEGSYEGDFIISRIFASSYQAGNRLIMEVRAMLEQIDLVNADLNPAEREQLEVEPDPIEEDRTTPHNKQSEQNSDSEHTADSESETDTPIQTESDPIDPDAALFGLLWPIGQTVKLDATVDRIRFRKQRDRLKELGYRFKPISQTWYKESE